MPLSPGTALQNGHYIIDALLEAAPNGDLYWGTHVVTGMPIYIQVLPLSPSADAGEVSALIARIERLPFSLQSPRPNPFHPFAEEGALYLAMGMSMGLPWLHACRPQERMFPKQALQRIRETVSGIHWLEAQGFSDIDLSPNRVWVPKDGDRLTLTGLPREPIFQPQAIEASSGATVQSLARLLYSFLLGELPQSTDADAWVQTLQQQLPNLSPLIVQAIRQGISNATLSPKEDLQQWLSMLPDAPTRYPESTYESQLTLYQPQPSQTTNRHWQLYPALGITALLAAIGGGALGTAWRLNAGSLPGAIQFDPNQSFPAQADWSADTPKAAFKAPYLPREEVSEEREDWLDSEWDAVQIEEEWEPTDPEWSGEPEEPADDYQDWETTDDESPLPPSQEPLKPEIVSPDNTTVDVEDPEPKLEILVPTPSRDGVFSDAAKPAPTPSRETDLVPAPAPKTTSES